MKSLATLLKLARQDLDALRRALAAELGRERDCAERTKGHEQTIESEQKMAQRDYESTRAYGGYAIAALAMRKALAAEREAIEHEVERLRALIVAAHAETRKFERLLELDAARRGAERQTRELAQLDEMATQRHSRRD